jgi:uncharacterized membrane protein
MTLSGRGATALVVALCLSVFINLVAVGFVGVIAGGAFVSGALLRQASGPVPPELRQSFRSELRANRRPVVAALLTLRRDRDALHAALTAETFDRTAVEQANAAIRIDVDNFTALVQGILVEAVAKLSPEVRRQIPLVGLGDQLLRSMSEPEAGAPPAN